MLSQGSSSALGGMSDVVRHVLGASAAAVATGAASMASPPELHNDSRKRPREDDEGSPGPSAPSNVFGTFTLFEGSPSYKQRRKIATASTSRKGTPVPLHSPDRDFRPSASPSLAYGDQYDTSDGIALRHSISPAIAMRESQHYPPQQQRYSLFPLFPQFNTRPFPAASYGGSYGVPRSNSTSYYQAAAPTQTHQPISCPLFSCGQAFETLDDLKLHVRSHSKEKPYLYALCLL